MKLSFQRSHIIFFYILKGYIMFVLLTLLFASNLSMSCIDFAFLYFFFTKNIH